MHQASTIRAGVAARVEGPVGAAQRLDGPARQVAAVAQAPAASAATVEPRQTVFFVRQRDRARYPQAEPAVLIDAAIAHRHPDCETIEEVEAVDPPEDHRQGPPAARPILVVEAREAPFWPRPRRLMIGRDSRTRRTAS